MSIGYFEYLFNGSLFLYVLMKKTPTNS